MGRGEGFPLRVEKQKQQLDIDPTSPLILICVGSGVGVGLALLQEHKVYQQQKRKVGPLFLLFCPLLSPRPPSSSFPQIVGEIEEGTEGGEEREEGGEGGGGGYVREVLEGGEWERRRGEREKGERRVVWFGGKLERLPQFLRKEGKILWPLLGSKNSTFSYQGPQGDLLEAIEKAIGLSSPFGTVVANQMIDEMKLQRRWRREGSVVDILLPEMQNSSKLLYTPTGTLKAAPIKEAFRWLVTDPFHTQNDTPTRDSKPLAGLLICLSRYGGEFLIIKELWRIAKVAVVSPQETTEFLSNFLDFWFEVTDVAFGVSFHLSGLHRVRREVLNLSEKFLPTDASRKVKMKMIHRTTISSSRSRRRSEHHLGSPNNSLRGSPGGEPKKRHSFFPQRPPSPSSPSLEFPPLLETSSIASSEDSTPPPSPSNSPPSPLLRSSILSSSFTLPSSSGLPSSPSRNTLSSSNLLPNSPSSPTKSQSSSTLFSTPSPKKTKLFSRDSSEALHIYDFPDREVASELAEMSIALYSKLTSPELLKCAWMKEGGSAGTVHGMSTFYNKITSWVAREILMSPGDKTRIRTYTFFARVANHLMELGDILSLAGVHGGLTHFTVMRIRLLKKYFDGGGKKGGGGGGGGEKKKELEILEKMSDLFCPTMNNANYRRFWKDLSQRSNRAVPYVAIHLRDIVFLEDGNPDFVGEEMLNLDKLSKLWDVVSNLMGGRRESTTPSSSPSSPDLGSSLSSSPGFSSSTGHVHCPSLKVRNYLFKKFEECPPNDDVLYGISHKLQPFRGVAPEEKKGNFVKKVLTKKLLLYCEKGDVKAALSMINEKLATPDLQDETTGDTAIHVCIDCGKFKMMKALIASLASSTPPNLPDSEKLKQTNETIARVLAIQNNEGNTPLHLACSHNDVDSVKFLLPRSLCPSLFIRNEEGLWPLSSASLLVRGVVRSEFITPRLTALVGGTDPIATPRDPPNEDCATTREEEGDEKGELGEKGKEKKRARLRKRKSIDAMENHLSAGVSLISRIVSFLQYLGNDEGARKAHAEEGLQLLLLALLHHFLTEEEYFMRTDFAETPSHILCQSELLQSVERCCLAAAQAREKGGRGVTTANLSRLGGLITARMEEEVTLFGWK